MEVKPAHSVNWASGMDDAEIINTSCGKKIQDLRPSRLSKIELYSDYKQLIAKLPPIDGRKMLVTYGETKKSSKSYQTAKEKFYAVFLDNDLGKWVKKPVEQEEFTI
jgi:double stranded RNA-specific editase B